MTSKVETVIGVVWGFFVRIALLAGLVYALYRVRSILVAVLLSVMLTYVILPAVEWLCSFRIKGWAYRSRRFWASLIVFIVLLGLMGVSIKYLVTPFVDEATDLSRTVLAVHDVGRISRASNEWFDSLPQQTQRLFNSSAKQKALNTTSDWLYRVLIAFQPDRLVSIPGKESEDLSVRTELLFNQFPNDVKVLFTPVEKGRAAAATTEWLRSFLKTEQAADLAAAARDARDFQQFSRKTTTWIDQLPPDIKNLFGPEQKKKVVDAATRWLAGLLQSTASWAKHILDIILIPVLAFYFALDYRSLRREFVGALPKARRKEAFYLLRHIGAILQNYIIGQLILCLIAGVVVGIALWGLEMKYALALGVLAGVTRAIPVIGPIISGIVIVILGLLKSPVLGLYLLVFFSLLHLIESKLILPKLIGDRMRLHPAVIIIVLLIGSEFFGILGMFLAAPVAAIIREMVRFYIIEPRRKREAEPESQQAQISLDIPSDAV